MTKGATDEVWLGVDVGTSAVKAVLAAAGGDVLARATSARMALVADSPLMAEQHPDTWWSATVEAIRACLAEAPTARVAGVGLTGQKHAFLPLDAARRPIRRAILWADGRAVAESRHVRDVFPAAGRRVGAHAVPGYLLPKWLWYHAHEPENAARTRHLVFAKDYIRLRLTGDLATDRTEASASLLYDFRSNTWSATLVPFFQLALEFLPEVLQPSDVSGVLSAEAAAETGLPAGVPVAAGAGDNEVAALACGAIGDGRVAVTLGTSGTAIGWQKVRSPAGGLIWNRHVVPEGYAATGTLLSAGRSLRWIRRVAYPQDTSLESVVFDAEASDPSRAPLVFLPGLVGERSPVPDPEATGAFVGLRAVHERGHLVRAVLEGVALSLGEILVLMRNAGVEVSELRLTSAGAASTFWRRLIAAAARVPVRVVSERHGPARGAAMIAAAMTTGEDLHALTETWVTPGPIEVPDPAEVERLGPLGTLLRSARNALRGVRTR